MYIDYPLPSSLQSVSAEYRLESHGGDAECPMGRGIRSSDDRTVTVSELIMNVIVTVTSVAGTTTAWWSNII